MTREEAIEKFTDIFHDPLIEYYNETWMKSKKFIDAFEALGLIRFEEKRVTVSFRSENYSTGLKIKVDDEVVYSSKD